ncbi:MAG: MFS transporter [Anaerolineae bacterium]
MSRRRGRHPPGALARHMRFLKIRARAEWLRARFFVRRLASRLAASVELALVGSRQAANERNLYLETFCFGVLSGVTTTFLEVFAVRLGATSFQIGLLTALPALVNVLVPVPAARLLDQQRGRRLLILLQTVVWQRLAYMLLALVPLLGTSWRMGAVVLLVALATVPAAVLNLGITVLIGDLASPRDRALVVSRRNVILGVTTMLVAMAGGWWLDLTPFPLNYQVLFGVGACASLLSLRYLRRIRLPEVGAPAAARPAGAAGLQWGQVRSAWGRLAAQRRFLGFLGSAFVYHWGLYLPAALYSIYRVRVLGASDRWIGSFTTLHTLANIAGYWLAGRLARRWREEQMLVWGAAGLAFYPILTALSTTLSPLLGVSVWGGLFGAGLNLALFNVSLALAPEGQRATYVALYTVAINLAAFAAPLVGSALAEAIGLREAMLLAGGVRLLGVGLFAWTCLRRRCQAAG